MRVALALGWAATAAMAIRLTMRRRRSGVPRALTAYRREAAVAIRLARRCGAAMVSADAAMRSAAWKDGAGGIDPCTATDRANEALVVRGLGREFPEHRVVGEESCSDAGALPALDDTDAPTWIVDPIDGTQNFVGGLPLSCVSLGLAVRGTPVLAVVFDPYRDELWVAAAGCGAFFQGERLAVKDAPEAGLASATVLTDLGYQRGAGARPLAAFYAALLRSNVFSVRILGTTVLSLCYVATGRATALVAGLAERDTPKPWDWCAGTLIAREAGCSLAMLDARRHPPGDATKPPQGGADFDLFSRSAVCAASPGLAAELKALALAAIAEGPWSPGSRTAV